MPTDRHQTVFLPQFVVATNRIDSLWTQSPPVCYTVFSHFFSYLDLAHDVHALKHEAEDDVTAVKVRRRDGADEELRAVGVGPCGTPRVRAGMRSEA
jgi:hypothetical protein